MSEVLIKWYLSRDPSFEEEKKKAYKIDLQYVGDGVGSRVYLLCYTNIWL